MELTCIVCKVEFLGEIPKICCNGVACGCLGLSIEPIVCSDECYNKLMKNE